MKYHTAIMIATVSVIGWRLPSNGPPQPSQTGGISPACKFLRPKPGETISGNSLRVLIEATDDDDVTNVRLFVNGVPVPERAAKAIVADAKAIPADAKNIPKGHKKVRAFVIDVPLPAGEKELTIRAVVVDKEKNTGDAAVKILVDSRPVASELYLLSVGLGRSRNPIYDVPYAAEDAQAFDSLMRGQKGKQYAAVHANLLLDAKATRAAIQKGLETLQSAKSSDMIMVFLSGHAVVDDDGRIYIAPHGLVVNDIEQTCVSWDDFVASLSRIYSKKLIFVDACHAGAKLGTRQATNEQLSSALRQTGIVMMAACSGDETSSVDASAGHGVFTVAILEAFEGKADVNQDGTVTLPELEIYIPRRVGEMTKSLQNPRLAPVQDFNPQTPLVRLVW